MKPPNENGLPSPQEAANIRNARSDSSALSKAKSRVTWADLMALHDEAVSLYHHSATDLHTTRLLVRAIMRKKQTYAAKAEELQKLIERAKSEAQ